MKTFGHFNPQVLAEMDADGGPALVGHGQQLYESGGDNPLTGGFPQALPPLVELVTAEIPLGAEVLDGEPASGLLVHQSLPMEYPVCSHQ